MTISTHGCRTVLKLPASFVTKNFVEEHFPINSCIFNKIYSGQEEKSAKCFHITEMQF